MFILNSVLLPLFSFNEHYTNLFIIYKNHFELLRALIMTQFRELFRQSKWELSSICKHVRHSKWIFELDVSFQNTISMRYSPRNSTRPMRFVLGFGKRNSKIRTVNDILTVCVLLACNTCCYLATKTPTELQFTVGKSFVAAQSVRQQ